MHKHLFISSTTALGALSGSIFYQGMYDLYTNKKSTIFFNYNNPGLYVGMFIGGLYGYLGQPLFQYFLY